MTIRTLLIASLVTALGVAHAATPAQTCQSSKNKEAGKYADCRQKAEGKYAITGDALARTTALGKCQTKYETNWPRIETRAGGACPTTGDQADIRGLVDMHTDAVAAALAQGPPRMAAWYVSSGQDIDDLERKNFNLFFFNRPDYPDLTIAERSQSIELAIVALDEGSQIVLPIDNFLLKNWEANDGMQAFVHTWGSHPKVYGFLLKDDVLTAPFPNEGTVDESALWIFRWYYKMIRNTAEDQRNSHNRDLARGKKIFVTVPFWYQDEQGREVRNPLNEFHMAMNPAYVENMPPDFFEPGAAWDIVMPYWYPHRARISPDNEEYIMDVLYREMAEAFPSGSRWPIIQVAAETPGGEYFYLEHDDVHGFDLSVQYERLRAAGLVNASNNCVTYYSANGHATVYDNLLHRDWVRDATDSNIYYRESGLLNASAPGVVRR